MVFTRSWLIVCCCLLRDWIKAYTDDNTGGTCGFCLSSFTIGSSLIGIGLTAGQAMASVTIGMLLACGSAYLSGVPGARYHVGYGLFARAAWGLWGSYFCVILNIFQCFVFYGTQMYFGGQAFVIILNSLSHSFLTMKNTLPERSVRNPCDLEHLADRRTVLASRRPASSDSFCS